MSWMIVYIKTDKTSVPEIYKISKVLKGILISVYVA
jgi:hypothetical protein